jgi:hypothetical protein
MQDSRFEKMLGTSKLVSGEAEPVSPFEGMIPKLGGEPPDGGPIYRSKTEPIPIKPLNVGQITGISGPKEVPHRLLSEKDFPSHATTLFDIGQRAGGPEIKAPEPRVQPTISAAPKGTLPYVPRPMPKFRGSQVEEVLTQFMGNIADAISDPLGIPRVLGAPSMAPTSQGTTAGIAAGVAGKIIGSIPEIGLSMGAINTGIGKVMEVIPEASKEIIANAIRAKFAVDSVWGALKDSLEFMEGIRTKDPNKIRDSVAGALVNGVFSWLLLKGHPEDAVKLRASIEPQAPGTLATGPFPGPSDGLRIEADSTEAKAITSEGNKRIQEAKIRPAKVRDVRGRFVAAGEAPQPTTVQTPPVVEKPTTPVAISIIGGIRNIISKELGSDLAKDFDEDVKVFVDSGKSEVEAARITLEMYRDLNKNGILDLPDDALIEVERKVPGLRLVSGKSTLAKEALPSSKDLAKYWPLTPEQISAHQKEMARPITDLDLQTGTETPPTLSTESHPLRQPGSDVYKGSKSVGTSLDDVLNELPDRPIRDVSTTTQSLINDVNRWLDGDTTVDIDHTRNFLTDLATNTPSFRYKFAGGEGFPGTFHEWESLVKDAAEWARKSDRVKITPSDIKPGEVVPETIPGGPDELMVTGKDLDDAAAYYKKDFEELTDDELRRFMKSKAVAAKPEEPTRTPEQQAELDRLIQEQAAEDVPQKMAKRRKVGTSLYFGLPLDEAGRIMRGWYSALKDYAEEKLGARASGQQIKNTLRKASTADEW